MRDCFSFEKEIGKRKFCIYARSNRKNVRSVHLCYNTPDKTHAEVHRISRMFSVFDTPSIHNHIYSYPCHSIHLDKQTIKIYSRLKCARRPSMLCYNTSFSVISCIVSGFTSLVLISVCAIAHNYRISLSLIIAIKLLYAVCN